MQESEIALVQQAEAQSDTKPYRYNAYREVLELEALDAQIEALKAVQVARSDPAEGTAAMES